jgi:hypothetical protein
MKGAGVCVSARRPAAAEPGLQAQYPVDFRKKWGDPRHAVHSVHEEVHSRLGCECRRFEDAAEMKAKVLAQYRGLGMDFTLNDRIAT